MATKYRVNLVKRSQANTGTVKAPRHSFAIMGNDRELTPNIVEFEGMLDSIGTNGELLGDEPYSDNGKHRRYSLVNMKQGRRTFVDVHNGRLYKVGKNGRYQGYRLAVPS
ncbi:hypothetical protein SEA_GIBBLES_117 [Gordonia phage Gibbles]|nr:hypothetical protein SEA_GIBBLES_117 [Gordonia phage Gibbles]